MVNLSISIPLNLVRWLEEYAIEHKLYTNGRPSIGKAASLRLQEQYNKEAKQ